MSEIPDGFDPREHLSASMDVKLGEGGQPEDLLGMSDTQENVTIEIPRSWRDRLLSWPWRPWIPWERRITFDAKLTPQFEGGEGWQRVDCDIEPVGPVTVRRWDDPEADFDPREHPHE